MPESAWNTERIVRLVGLVLLVVACLQVILPFLGAITWAGIIAITIWPFFVWLTARLGNRPRLSATLCSLGLIVLLVLPLVLLAINLGQAVPQVGRLVEDIVAAIPPETPSWMVRLPVVGEVVDEMYGNFVSDMAGATRRMLPAAEGAGVWALAQGANIALAVLEFLFAILIAGVLLVTAGRSAEIALQVISRLNIGEGRRILGIVVGTVRSVSVGLLGTAMVQSLVAGLGFMLAGVPPAGLLAFLTFMLALVQLPTFLVWGPVAVWLFVDGQTGPAIFLTIWGFALVNTVDNIVRPYLISRGAKLPFALILMGVLGGILAWGVIGLFIGPTLLAVVYTLIVTWVGEARAAAAEEVGMASDQGSS